MTTSELKTKHNRKSLILFAAFPVGYWLLKFFGFYLRDDPNWLVVLRLFFGMTSFVLAYFVAGRTSDTSLGERERLLFRAICFIAISPVIGFVIR
jgi:hypothetical protein